MGKIIIDMPSEPLQEAVENKVKLDLDQRLGLDHVVAMIAIWGRDRKITTNGVPITQAIKTLEECHELLEAVNAALPSNALAKIGIEDIQNYHTAAVDAAKLAKLANAGYLVLYHLLPAPRNAIMEDVFLRGVKDEFSNYILSKDGTMVALPTNSDEILIKHVN